MSIFLRFALGAAIPPALLAALVTIGNPSWFPTVFAVIYTPLVLLRNPLQRGGKSVFGVAMIYGFGLTIPCLVAWVTLLAIILKGDWPTGVGLLKMSSVTLIGWAMAFTALVIGFGIPTAAWLKQLSDNLDLKETSTHA